MSYKLYGLGMESYIIFVNHKVIHSQRNVQYIILHSEVIGCLSEREV